LIKEKIFKSLNIPSKKQNTQFYPVYVKPEKNKLLNFAVSENTVYLNNGSGLIFAISKEGVEKWRFALSANNGMLPIIGQKATANNQTTESSITKNSILLKNNVLYVVKGNKLYAINANGNAKWKYEHVCDIISTSIKHQGNILYCTTIDNQLLAIDLNGRRKWSFQAEDRIDHSSIVFHTNAIYFTVAGNKLHALRLNGVRKWQFFKSSRQKNPPRMALHIQKPPVKHQSYNGRLYLGIPVILNSVLINQSSIKQVVKPGAGLLLEYQIQPFLSINTGFVYTLSEYQINQDSVKSDLLYIPFYLKLKIPGNKYRPYLNLGFEYRNFISSAYKEYDFTKYMSLTQFALVLGLGNELDVGFGWLFFDIMYSLGLGEAITINPFNSELAGSFINNIRLFLGVKIEL